MKQFFRVVGKVLWNACKILVILILICILAVGIYFYQTYGEKILALKEKAETIAKNSEREDFRASLTSIVYDSNGEKISMLRSGKDVYYLTYEEIPKDAIDVMLVTEDRKFYSHSGVDLLANVRAFYYLLKNKGEITQGGSTITQQLARTIYLTNEVTYERKLVEVFLAWELEKQYSKTDILEFYFNNIYFSNGFYGIQAAAKGYFNKSVQNLSLSEIVFLCAIPNNPSLYDPYLQIDKTIERRNRMLLQMLQEEKITEQEYKAAIAEEVVLEKGNGNSHHNYVETYVYYCAIRAFMEKDGFVFQNSFEKEEDKITYEKEYQTKYAYWQQELYTGGYRVYTSIDLQKQKILQEAVNLGTEEFTDVNEEGIYALQASAVCIDNETGYVVAIVGGREQDYVGYTLNRAYQSFRQPGSSIKPLIVYTPWFERGLTPDTMVLDEKLEDGPVNAGGYLGEITVRTAVEKSQNTIAWKLFSELTPKVGLSYLKKMNFRKIVSNDYVPAAALGGFTYGVSAIEMASAYATIENEGIFRTPTCIVRITDSDGKEIISNTMEEKRIYTKEAANTMTNVLKGVMINGTARKNNLETAIAAGKTGTTDDKKDGWFVGYTAYYTTSVWVGYDMPKTVEGLSGNTYPLAIWKTYMDNIHKELPIAELDTYAQEETQEVKSDTIEKNDTPPEIIKEENTNSDAISSKEKEEDTTESKENSAEDYRVTPPPQISWGEQYDPTKDPN